MAEQLRVDAEGLRSHAAVCDASAAALPLPTPATAGHTAQASTSAVSAGHALVDAVAARLAARATSTGFKLRTADGVYRHTDGDSAQSISSVQV